MENFDLNWFLTIPGMLISAGVLLLVVAVIVLISSSAKGKKEKKRLEQAQAQTNPVADNPQAVQAQGNAGVDNPGLETNMQAMPTANAMPVVNNANPTMDFNGVQPTLVDPMNPVVNTEPVVPSAPISVPLPTSNEVEAVPVEPFVAPSMPVEPAIPVMPVEPAPVEPVVPVMPATAAPVEPVVPVMPATAAPVEPVVPVMPATAAPVEPVVPVMPATATPVEPAVPVMPATATPVEPAVPVMPATATPVEPVTPMMTSPVTQESVMTVNQGVDMMQQNAQVVQPVYAAPVYTEQNPVANDVNAYEAVVQQAPTVVNEVPVQPVIYGGASPVVSNLNFEQNATHQIYGGANPLENTQSMPIMGNVNPVNPNVNQATVPSFVNPNVSQQQFSAMDQQVNQVQ